MRTETAESRRLQAEAMSDPTFAKVLLELAENIDSRSPAYREAILREASRRMLPPYKRVYVG